MTIDPQTQVSSNIEGPTTAAPARRPSVFVALAVSVDGYITGPDPSPAQALGRDGGQLFDWYTDGDVPSREFDGFRLSVASAQVFDSLSARVGAVIAGRRTYDHSDGWHGGSPHPSAQLFVLTHQPPDEDDPRRSAAQTFITTGIQDAVAAAEQVAGAAGKDVALMGSVVTAVALQAGLLDEVTLHQVPVLLGGGTAFFAALPRAVPLELVAVVPAPGVTHLTFSVGR